MSFEKAIEASLAGSLGDDQALLAELRGAFLSSARGHVCSMRDAGSDEIWADAALRLKSLAASFGATDLMIEAGRAGRSRSGDRATLAALEVKLLALSA